MYEDCAEQAQRSGDDDLADLVLMHRALAEVMAGQAVPEDRLERFADRASSRPPIRNPQQRDSPGAREVAPA